MTNNNTNPQNLEFKLANNKLKVYTPMWNDDKLNDWETKIIEYIKTGFKLFDEMTYGLPKGKLIKIQAPTGEGKTSLLMSLMLSAADHNPNKKFLYIDYEMSEAYFDNAIISYTHGISQKELLYNKKQVRNQLNINVLNELRNISYLEYNPFDKSFWKNVFVFCNQMHYDVIFFDYIGTTVASGDEAYWLKLKEEASIIAANAKSYNIGVVLAQQTNKETKQLDKHNLPKVPLDECYSAGSSQVAQKVDVSMTLIQLDKQKDGSYLYRLDLHKGRQGQDKVCRYFQFNIDKFALTTLSQGAETTIKKNYEVKDKKEK